MVYLSSCRRAWRLLTHPILARVYLLRNPIQNTTRGKEDPRTYKPHVQSQINRTVSLKPCILLFFYILTHFRWIVPSNGAITLRIKFYSSVFRNFEQTFNRWWGPSNVISYNVGICPYPTIRSDPKWVTFQKNTTIQVYYIYFNIYWYFVDCYI